MAKERRPKVARRAGITGIDAKTMNLGNGQYSVANRNGDERVAVGGFKFRDSIYVEAF
jgi:hypothetical protein